MTLSTSIPRLGTADLGLLGGIRPQRSSVLRTPGKSLHSALVSGDTCRSVSRAPAISAIFRAWAKATSLASEKSDGCRMLSMIRGSWVSIDPLFSALFGGRELAHRPPQQVSRPDAEPHDARQSRSHRDVERPQ